jgi:23S rRNA (uridine2552-2'-O)-methyltransferase
LTKLFQGEGQRELEERLRTRFGRIKRVKPKASRAESREIYLLASDYRMV